ncbi:right-handed parallel beta-helix repeat-containing protein [Laceyella putida]|uniref:Right-handed parallel beta-helix repeat-containing protein n=1 Tax=Laceyella putida TaxID=110101 RepID=A0ABW2RKQ3_9BACL
MANEWRVPGDFATINTALASPMVQDYDTIRVAPGLYTNASELGPIIITKMVQLLGAQAGVDARTRSGDPSQESVIEIVDPNGSVQINQNHVVFDGFTVRNNTVGFGVTTSNAFSGYWIFNNIIRNNEGGLYFNNDTTVNNTISQAKFNFFDANNGPGGAGGNGIYTDLGSINVFIESNRFTGHDPAASINFAAPASLSQRNIIISNNEMITDNSIALTNTTNVKITGNRMTNTQGSAIFIAGGNNLTEIERNVLHNSISNGIYVNTIFSGTPNANIRAKNNSIQGNASAGLRIDPGAYTITPRRLDATNNWWGSPTGPTNPLNPGGTGDAVVDPDNVSEFIPFLLQDPIGPTCQELLAACRLEVATLQRLLAADRTDLGRTQRALDACRHQLADALCRLKECCCRLENARKKICCLRSKHGNFFER